MGELILCNPVSAEHPYYINENSLNIYSLEELSYYIANNLYLLELDFMNEALCTWVDEELKLHEIAEQLKEIYQRDGELSEFVACILNRSSYFRTEQVNQIVTALKNMENKSEFECMKMKADRYMEKERYTNAICEYRKLLRIKDEPNKILVGNVWHNLGCACTGLFLFCEAAECFSRAYQQNENPESLREYLYTYLCMHNEDGFYKAVAELEVPEELFSEVIREFKNAENAEEISQFEKQMEELFAEENESEIHHIVTEWKETYRKNCKI